MFGLRSDGKRIKHLNGLYNIIPMLMKTRNDSMNWMTIEMDLEPVKKFIKEQQEATGRVYSYFDILLASIVRTIALRPALNRFVVNKRIFQRNYIAFSLALQKSLKRGVESDESTVKVKFDGTENLEQIIDRVDKVIVDAKKVAAQTKTDDIVNKIMHGPHYLMTGIVNLLMWLDKHGMLPGAVLEASPFHTTFFITDMKSIKLPPLHHHVYNFGTTGLFFSTSTEEKKLYKDPVTGEIKEKDIMKVAFVSDERFCDGYYFSVSARMMRRLWANPNALLKELNKEDLPLTVDEQWKKDKADRKAKAKEERIAKKQAKKDSKKNK
ncbi:MAG: hypothetical protein K6G38_04255 [Gammaproteobacteria bacterium]|nr:hypothetical protein [Gammaproteobacteria bacterium]